MDTRARWLVMRRSWRIQTLATLILPIAVVWFFHDRAGADYRDVGLPLFALGLLSLLLTVWRFRHYRASLLQVDQPVAGDDTESVWNLLHRNQLLGLTNAKLPGWIGMLHYVCTMEIFPLVLLVLASLGAMSLYRPAPQRLQ